MDDARKSRDPQTLTSRWWSEAEFLDAASVWKGLLMQSNCDPLFMSWEWQSTWWRHFSGPNGLALKILAVYNDDGELVGLAPMFETKRSLKGLPVKSLQIIGNIWRGARTVTTEYLKFIAKNVFEKKVYDHIADTLLSTSDELVITNAAIRDLDIEYFIAASRSAGALVRTVDRSESRHIDTRGDFGDYLKTLGRKTRRGLFNKRGRLNQLGEVKYRVLETGEEEYGLELLNDFHRRRFGVPVYEDTRLNFQTEIFKILSRKNQLSLQVLSVGEVPQSCTYNVRIGKYEYGIQIGFNQELCKQLSLGKLHLGYSIEDAFDSEIEEFDFLAGGGKVEDYKTSIAKNAREIGCVHVIMSPTLKLIYRLGMRVGLMASR